MTTRSDNFDPALIEAWLTARSVARDIPLPVPDRGGFRVDTSSAKEIQRWVFPRMADGLVELGREISEPCYFLKLCAKDEDLIGVMPARWQIQRASYVMTLEAAERDIAPIAAGYDVEIKGTGATTHVRILAANGEVAASGYAAEFAGVFIYDRIETAPAHRRRGLGRALMTVLGTARKSWSAPQILVATEDGRWLYASLGWSVYAPYATVTIPAQS